MKKIFYLAIAALAFAACARELAPETESNLPKVKVSIKAILDQEDVTKAEINMSNGTASWEAGDQIAVHTKNGKLATLEAESAGTSVTFSGTVDAGDDIEDGAIAYYPASIAIEGNDAKVNMPASYASAAAAAKGFPMRGVLTGDAVEFKHIGGLMKVSVNDVPSEVTSLVFTAASVAVSGELDVDATAPKCVVGSASSSITITSAAADRAAGTAVFYIPLPTGVLTGGFSLALKNGSDDVYVKTSTNGLEITRAKLFKMKTFAPEGNGSEWYLAGKFNGWSTTANQMTAVVGHEEWIVARNITLPNDDTDKGFKFFNNGTWKGGDCSALHTQFDANLDSNIDFTHGQAYDIYYNPTTNKFFLANAGEPWYYRTIYMMTDMVLSDDTYSLHLWQHGTEYGTKWPGVAGTTETISGIKYYKFDIAINECDMVATSYDCIFHNADDTKRYDFRDGKLVTNDSDAIYYLSFTGNKYNKAVAEGNSNATYGNATSNPMTQFADPAHPQGESYWGVYVNDSSLKYMHWDNGPILVYNNLEVGPDTKLRFCFKWDGGHFYGLSAAGDVEANVDFSVVHSSSAAQFQIPSLDGTYICDVYLDPIKNTAKIVPYGKNDATVTLYFGLTDIDLTTAYFYTFGSWYNQDWPGVEMTEYETINHFKYYKTVVPATKVWDKAVNLIIAGYKAGSSSLWQTANFESADWSGHQTEYYFEVKNNTITQISAKPVARSFTIDGKFGDWADISGESFTNSGKTTTMKAYSNGTNLYVYLNMKNDNGTAMTYSNDESYFRLYFDTDNKADTGYDTSNWIYGGSNYITSDNTKKNILAFYYKSNSVSGACFRGYDTTDVAQQTLEDAGATIKAADDGTNGVLVELMIPLSLIETISGKVIKIFSIGGGGYYGKLPNVIVAD